MEYTLEEKPYDVLKETLYLPKLSDEECLALIEKAQAGNIEARNKIIEHNMKLIYIYANIYYNVYEHTTAVDISDLISEGIFGLIRAIELFEFDVGTKFSTYAVIRIKSAIRRSLKNSGYMIRIPNYVQDLYNRINVYVEEYENTYCKMPNTYELFEYINRGEPFIYNGNVLLTYDKLIEIIELTNYKRVLSLNNRVTNNDTCGIENELIDFIIDDKEKTAEEKYLLKERTTVILNKIYSYKTSDRNRKMILNRFGFNKEQRSMTLKEIAQSEGITKERVRQIIDKFINEVRYDGTLDIYEDLIY